jgi:hypothetical protein
MSYGVGAGVVHAHASHLLSKILFVALALAPVAARAADPEPLVGEGAHEFNGPVVLGKPGGHFVVDKDVTIVIKGGNKLEIVADTVDFKGTLTIEGRGAEGVAGEAGADRGDTWTSGGPDPHADWEAAGSEVDVGTPGLPGGPGGSGASVTISIASQSAQAFDARIIRHLEGGPGGRGGHGGRGRPLQCGAHKEHLKYGNPGPVGAPGPNGADGHFRILTNDAQKEIVDATPIAYGIIASGGISAGTYEAGYNWSLIRYLKARNAGVQSRRVARPVNLVAVTGASAGSINTVLSAVTWCQTKERDDKEDPTSNIFFKTWLPVGFDKLLPAAGYKADDALLSREAFAQVQASLVASMHDPARYRDKCRLPIGLTVTKRTPELLHAKSLIAPVDRFSVALEARTSQAGLDLYDVRYQDEVTYAKPYLHVVQKPAPLDDDRIKSLLRASSAFPVAFGLEKLDYFESAPTVVPGESLPGRLQESKPGYFWDGGLYDNLPVGLALSLVQKPPYDQKIPESRIRLVALDPNRRRSAPPADTDQHDPAPPRGLRRVPEIAANMYSVARNYELQNFIRFALPTMLNCPKESNQPCVEDPLVSSRQFPIYGERLGAFGAFVLRAFREFDFAAGVYDGIFSFADDDCARDIASEKADPSAQVECLLKAFYASYNDLKVDRDKNSAYLLRHFLSDELSSRYPSEVARGVLSSTVLAPGLPASQWLATAPKPFRYIAMLYDDTSAVERLREPESTSEELDRIDGLVGRLALKEVRAELDPGDRRLVDNADNWLPETINRVIRRDQVLEAEDRYSLGREASNLASFAYGSLYLMTRRGLDLDPSTVPDDYASWRNVPFHFMPPQAGFSTREIELGWRPTWAPWRYLALGMPLSLSRQFGDKDPYDWGAHAGAVIVGRLPFIPISALEVGPRYTVGWMAESRPSYRGWGGEAAVYVLGGKVRIAASLDGFEAGWPARLALTFGFADLNGMLFHTCDFWGLI